MLQVSAEVLALSGEAAILVKNGRIVFANAAARAILGEDCVDSSLKNVFPIELAEVQAPSYIGEFSIGGKHYVLRVSSCAGVKAMFISHKDVMPELLSDAFIYSLRSCLMGLGVTTELLRSKCAEDDSELLDCIASVSHDCYRINRILSNVSVIRSAGRGELYFAPEKFKLSKMLSELLETIKAICPQTEFVLSVPEELSIIADPSLIESLVLNLISNSLLHAKNSTRISVRVLEDKERIYISVTDDGDGIPEEELHTVFERFHHSFSLSEMAGGPGLGLSACRCIARLHGGTLMLESRAGIGTTVRASVNKATTLRKPLRDSQNAYSGNIRTVLTGLADCLPMSVFAGSYTE